MIGIMLLTAGVIVAGGVIGAFWEKIQGWLKRVIEKISVKVQGIIEGTKIAFVKMQEGTKEVAKNYAKVGTKWQETVVYRTVEMSEIPDKYKDRLVLDQEVDFTDELEAQLQLR